MVVRRAGKPVLFLKFSAVFTAFTLGGTKHATEVHFEWWEWKAS